MKKKLNHPGTLLISDNESGSDILLQLQLLEEINISIHSTIQSGNSQLNQIKQLLARLNG